MSLFPGPRHGPIGVDLGIRSVKLLQLDAARRRVLDGVRWDVAGEPGATSEADASEEQLARALRQAREGRRFRGREAVVCLSARDLYIQNVRIPKGPTDGLQKVIRRELEGRLPFPLEETELRCLEADDVRHGDTVKREVIALACHRPAIERTMRIAETAGLAPVAIDVEPLALLRCYLRQFRRDEDAQQSRMFVHMGASNTAVVIARGGTVLFVKYVNIGGRQLDEAVARHLKMSLPESTALRRHNGDRRAEQQDPEIVRGVADSIRPVLERWMQELSLCTRYHSVTFRGQTLALIVLGGGEASPALCESLKNRLGVKCEIGEPLRDCECPALSGRGSQWDIAAGLGFRVAGGA